MRVERLTACLALIVGLGLIGLAGPRVPAALEREAANAVLRHMGNLRHLPPPAATAIARASQRAIAWHETGHDRTRLARLAQQQGQNASARRWLLRHLRQAPADPAAWTRLAALRHIAGEPQAATTALVMALRTSPQNRHLVLMRAELILRHWPRVRTRVPARSLHRQLTLAHAARPEALQKIATAAGQRDLLQLVEKPPPRP